MIQELFYRFATSQACPGGDFFGLPKWYIYLQCKTTTNSTTGATIQIPQINGLSDIWLIVAAIVELLLRVAAIAAFAMIVYGGVQLITSQGNPDSAAKARGTLINAIIGLAISVLAATLVTFIAGRFNG